MHLQPSTWLLSPRRGPAKVWSAWFIRFMAERGLFTLYANLPGAATLCANARLSGLNYQRSGLALFLYYRYAIACH